MSPNEGTSWRRTPGIRVVRRLSPDGLCEFDEIDPGDPLTTKIIRGRGLDPVAIATAEEVLVSFRHGYPAWAREDLAKLRQAADALRAAAPSDAGPRAQAAYVHAHDIRGQAGSFGYPLLGQIAGSLCRLLHEGGCFGERQMNTVDAHIAALGLVLEQGASASTAAAQLASELSLAVDRLIAG